MNPANAHLPDRVPRFNVLGTGVSALDLARACGLVVAARGRKRLGYVCLATVHGLNEARRDPALRGIFNRSYLTTPDGMPLVWLGHRHGHAGVTRVYGPDLLHAVCAAGREGGLTHYFLGGHPGVAEKLRDELRARHPGVAIVGTFTPPFRPLAPDESAALRAEVVALAPDIVWVGLGTPKQERFMAEYAPLLDTGLLIGIGAAFDFVSGRVRQAPRWLQRAGLEWLFRLVTEPRRLGRRYLVGNPLFVLRIFLQLAGLKKYPIETFPAETPGKLSGGAG